MKIQPRIKGNRKPLGTRVIKELNSRVEFTSRKFNCSKSFVIAVALAEFFGIRIERYDR